MATGWGGEDAEGEVLWAMADHLGSVRDVIDSNADLRIHRQFDTFGNIVDEVHYDTDGDIVVSGPGFVTEAFAFTGRWRDPVTGLQNNLFRWYDPATGGWIISEDPLPLPFSDENPNRYVNNTPTQFLDPLGLQIVDEVIWHNDIGIQTLWPEPEDSFSTPWTPRYEIRFTAEIELYLLQQELLHEQPDPAPSAPAEKEDKKADEDKTKKNLLIASGLIVAGAGGSNRLLGRDDPSKRLQLPSPTTSLGNPFGIGQTTAQGSVHGDPVGGGLGGEVVIGQ